MLTLRLSRKGTKKRPVYHLVAADSRARRDGRFVEVLGYYIPAKNVISFKQDRISYWMGVGAQISDSARRLVRLSKTVPPPVVKKRSAPKKAETTAPKAAEAAS